MVTCGLICFPFFISYTSETYMPPTFKDIKFHNPQREDRSNGWKDHQMRECLKFQGLSALPLPLEPVK